MGQADEAAAERDRALASAQEFAARFPNSPTGNVALAVAYAARRNGASRRAYEAALECDRSWSSPSPASWRSGETRPGTGILPRAPICYNGRQSLYSARRKRRYAKFTLRGNPLCVLKCLGCESAGPPTLHLGGAVAAHRRRRLFKLGLHNRPNDLRDRLQERIDATPADEYDAIVLGYGICGKATVGLVSQSLPMIIPRAHDCITLYLGDRMRYKDQFEQQPGTYWYTVDYLERHKAGEALGATAASTDLAEEYEKFVEKFGKDNADYLMEVMGAWQAHYEARRLHRHGRGRQRRRHRPRAGRWPNAATGASSAHRRPGPHPQAHPGRMGREFLADRTRPIDRHELRRHRRMRAAARPLPV